MPFYTIDWSRYSNHSSEVARGGGGNAIDASVVIRDTSRLLFRIWKYSGHWLGYKTSKKYRWFSYAHRFLLIILFAATLGAASLSFRFWSSPFYFDSPTIQRITLTLIYWQCVACNVAFLRWQLSGGGSGGGLFKGFVKMLNAATMGIGLVRQKHCLRRFHYVSLICFGTWSLLLVSYHALGIYLPRSILADFPYPWNNRIAEDDSSSSSSPTVTYYFFWYRRDLEPVSLLLLVYGSFNWFMAHAIVADMYAYLTAEIDSLNSDMRADSNLYQVPVFKHYTTIYHRLSRLNRYLNRALGGPLLTVNALVAYTVFVLNCVLAAIRYDSMSVGELGFAAGAALMTGSYLLAFVMASLTLRKKGLYFYDVIQDVVTMDWNLDSEYYPVAACNAAFGRRLSIGFALGAGWIVTGRLLIKILLCTAAILILLLLKIT